VSGRPGRCRTWGGARAWGSRPGSQGGAAEPVRGQVREVGRGHQGGEVAWLVLGQVQAVGGGPQGDGAARLVLRLSRVRCRGH
jgi:hypothetical protein